MIEQQLPDGWRWLTIGDIAEIDGGLTRNAEKRAKATVQAPLVSVGAVHLREIRVDQIGKIGLLDSDGDKATLREGDLLVVEGNGSLEHIGRVALWDGSVPNARHQNHLIRVRPREVSSSYVLEWLASPLGRTAIVAEATSAAGLYNLSLSKIARIPVPLAPPAHQPNIVAKIEALTQKSRRAKEALDAIPPLLERFRQSVLASAFRGDLTKDWRAKHPDVEPAGELLKRIRQERRKRWEEAELAKLKEKGKAPKDDRWKEKYEEPEPVDAEGLPELPEGWCWASVGELSNSLDYGTAEKSARIGDVPVLRMGNLQAGEIDWSDLVYTSDKSEIAKYRLEPNTVLFNRTNSPELVGKTALYRGERAAVFAGYLIKVDHVSEASPAFISCALNSPYGRAWCWSVKSDGVSQSNISASKLATFPIPLCSFAEQQRVVESAERMLQLAVRAAEQTRDATENLINLDASILAKAFRGELTSDSNHE